MKRFLTVVLSIIIFATIFSWVSYVPSSQREPNVYYFGYSETFILGVIYSAPAYFLVGLPLSIFIDKLIEGSKRQTKWGKYFVGLGLYSLVGILVGFIFLFIFFGQAVPNSYHSLGGIIASNIYFHLSLLISKINEKYRFN